MKVETTEQWKEWLSSRRWNSYVFPVYLMYTDEWMIFEPDGDNYMLVSREEYLKYWEEQKQCK